MIGLRPPAKFKWYLDHECPVPIDIYREFARQLSMAVVENPEGCTLPLKLGWMKVIGNSRPPSIAKGKTVEVFGPRSDKKVPETAYNTDGLIFKVFWFSSVVGATEDVTKAGFRHADMYGFKSAKVMKRCLFDKISEGLYREYHLRNFVAKGKSTARRGRPRKTQITDDTTRDSQQVEE